MATSPGPPDRVHAPDQHAPAIHPGRLFAVGALVGGLVGALSASAVLMVGDNTSPITAPSAAETTESTTAPSANVIDEIVTRSRPSIVAIHDEMTQTDTFGQPVQGQAAGTGFVLTPDGYVVTNNHVVEGATDITVDFADRTSVPARVIAADPGSDLAVLKVDRTDLTPLPQGDSDTLHVGDQVLAIGNALDLSGEPSVTTGIISATGRSLTEPNGEHLTNLLQTDTAINPGNSGGPLLDMAGQAIGVNTAIAGKAQNIGFAIAITPARAAIEQLQAGEVPEHAVLGVSATPSVGDNGPDGAVVAQVNPGSPADNAGLRPGDVITGIDDTTISTPDDLGAAVAAHQPGDRVEITYVRNGHVQAATATLGARRAADS